MGAISILAYGHGDGAYAYYAISLYPGDSNYITSSLCNVLKALEKPLICEFKLLFPHPPTNNFFKALLKEKSTCRVSILPSRRDFVYCNQVPLTLDMPQFLLQKLIHTVRQFNKKQLEKVPNGNLLIADYKGDF